MVGIRFSPVVGRHRSRGIGLLGAPALGLEARHCIAANLAGDAWQAFSGWLLEGASASP
jgi:hypothetical protein